MYPIRPLFYSFFCGTTAPGFLEGRGGNMWLPINHECFFSKFTLTACCWLGNIVHFHIRLTRLWNHLRGCFRNGEDAFFVLGWSGWVVLVSLRLVPFLGSCGSTYSGRSFLYVSGLLRLKEQYQWHHWLALSVCHVATQHESCTNSQRKLGFQDRCHITVTVELLQ